MLVLRTQPKIQERNGVWLTCAVLCKLCTLNSELCRHRCFPSAVYHCARVNSRVSKLSALDFQELDACFLKHVETLVLLQLSITLQISQDTMTQLAISKRKGTINFFGKTSGQNAFLLSFSQIPSVNNTQMV